MDQISLLSPLSSNDRSIPLRDQVPENADLLQNHRITGDYLVKPWMYDFRRKIMLFRWKTGFSSKNVAKLSLIEIPFFTSKSWVPSWSCGARWNGRENAPKAANELPRNNSPSGGAGVDTWCRPRVRYYCWTRQKIRHQVSSRRKQNIMSHTLFIVLVLVKIYCLLYLENYVKTRGLLQGCGSGSGLDPYSIGSVDPDPYSEFGSGSRRAKMTHKSRQ